MLKRRSSVPLSCRWAAFAAVGCCASAWAAHAQASERPNIVLIVTDDQGWGDLSCHGNPVLETPHLDGMFQRGGRLTNFHVSPVCSPTRACLMTGRYNYRTRVIDTYNGRSMMDPAEVTVAELLRDAGYQTGLFGKWHLGDCYPMRAQDQGFGRCVTLRGGGLAQPSEPLENNRRYTDPILWRNGQQFQARGYCTDVFFREAIDFIREAAGDGKPFLAYIATNAPHGPYHDVPQALYDKYKHKDLSEVLLDDSASADTVARVFAMVENIDENVGKLLAELDSLELTDDTLVIFMTDNGPNTRRYVGNRRGMKTEVHEGGIVSPFFVQWPDRVAAGSAHDALAAHIDVMPTLLAAAGVAQPSGVAIDGVNLLPLLTGNVDALPERTLFLQTHRGQRPIAGHHMAAVTSSWKLVRPSGFGRSTPNDDAPFELYDLRADPQERTNVFASQPLAAQRLRREYADWFREVSATRPDNYAPPRIIVGNDRSPEVVLTRQDWQTDESGWGRQGEWLIRVEQTATCTATVILESPAAGEATLRVGQQRFHSKIAEAARQIDFDDMTLPAGDGAVAFEIITAEGSQGPYQIVLRARSNAPAREDQPDAQP